ncbi:hypothetical protein EI555_021426 [Monodon monoceros]|uniref:G-protein coupled receptors family 1 profile domain-containing protein n=1 Tax=Monodon monoceros TaxID=40151 RepID=A0A4U1ETR3_MONMO|nr:hypothetical protein EI555_021426 [Monodon monoceros]
MQHSPLFPINSKCPQIPRTSRLLVQHTSDWPSSAEVRGAMGNHATVTEFVLLGLSDACELQMLIFLGLLLTCVLTLLVLTLMDRHLHTPMYYFLRNFAILEIWFTLVIFPKMLSNILTRYRTIFLAGCFLQFFLYFFLGTTEFYRLAVMSFDSCIFMYVQSGKGGQGEDRNNVVALLNTMVTPMFNPFIYTLRNKQVISTPVDHQTIPSSYPQTVADPFLHPSYLYTLTNAHS